MSVCLFSVRIHDSNVVNINNINIIEYVKKIYFNISNEKRFRLSEIIKNLDYIYNIIEDKEYVVIDDIVGKVNNILLRIIDYKKYFNI